jgi:hypothetical protein
MRSRVRTAATVILAGAFLAVVSAGADARTPRIPERAAANPSQINLLRGDTGFSLFPSSAQLTPGSSSFAFSGATASGSSTYSITPILAPLTASLPGETATLRESNFTAALGPGVQLNFASWQNPVGSSPWDARAAGLSATAPGSPYLGLGAGGYYIGAGLALSDTLRLTAGHSEATTVPVLDMVAPLPQGFASGLTGSSIASTTAGIDWSFARWGNVGVNATQSGASLVGGGSADTTALGISARVGFGEGWVSTFAYNEGVTQLDLRQNGLINNLDTVRTQTYGLGIAKHGLFGDDVLGIAVSRPLQLFGNANFAALSGKNTAGLRPNAAAESDIQVGYVTTFLDGALALQANAAYQMNANGDKGQDAVSVLSRAKIKF